MTTVAIEKMVDRRDAAQDRAEARADPLLAALVDHGPFRPARRRC